MKRLVTGILAHVDAGKTTLSEALLYKSGFLKNPGRVDNKDAFLDNDDMERARGITIFSKQAILSCPEGELVLLDTPGHVDFSAEMERVLGALDVAILVISGSDGVQSHTRTLWRLLKRYDIPVIVFVNKMDMPNADADKVIASLHEELSSEIVDIKDPDSMATCSEALLEEYLEMGEISKSSIKEAVLSRHLFPLVMGSALRCEGIEELIHTIFEAVEEPEYGDKFGAYCIKITRDDKGVRLTHLKITGGRIRIKDILGEEKVNEIRVYNGTKYTNVEEATSGMVVVIPGLQDTNPGMCLGHNNRTMKPLLEPVLSYAIRYPSDVDAIQMLRMLHELEEELPELQIEEDSEHHEIRVSLMGVVQTEILTELIRERYSVGVTFDVGSISYKETIANVVEGVGHFEPLRHYAEVHLRMEPGEPGSGMQFDTKVSEDLLAKNWQRLILTHLEERMHRGVLTGSPITDMKITVVGGQAHNKHTEGGDFRQATYRAVRQGLMQAANVLLEPYYEYTLQIPEAYVGRAMTDIDRMHGTAVVAENVAGVVVLEGRAPVATMHLYATDIAAYTRGEGILSLANGGYDKCHNPEEVILKRRYDPDSDMRNPSASVFCSHGVGTIVPWDQVFDYMHVPSCIEGMVRQDIENIIAPINRQKEQKELFIGTDEIDEIINKTAHANKKTVTAHKGISAARARQNRENRTIPAREVEYKGYKAKDKYLLVDGYNVIFAWKELSELAALNIDGARDRLLDIMCNYQAMDGSELIVVFDAYKVKNHGTEYLDYHNIHVVYTKTAQTADSYIEHFAHEHSKKYDITVATSDGLEQIITRGEGCNLISSREFEKLVAEKSKEFAIRHNIK